MLRHNVRLDRIHYLPVEDIKCYGRKLRKRSDRAALALQTSVSSFGLVVPLLIDEHNTIIGGEGLFEAAKSLGYTEVPTIRIDHLDENEVRLLRIALNKLAEQAEWDTVELGAEFSELLEFKTELAYEVTGFSTVEVDNLVHSPPSDNVKDEADLPAPVGERGNEVTRLGDMWDLGRHRVRCSSSLEVEELEALMGQERARTVVTDHPYNVPIGGHVSGLGKNKHREFAQASGEMSEAEFIEFLTQSIIALAAYCVEGAVLYMFMDWRHQWEMMSGIRAAGLKLINMAAWVKSAGGMGSFYRSQYELVYITKKGSTPHRNNVQLGRFGRTRTNCWFYPGMNSFGAGRDELLAMHPTSKPLALCADAIRDASDHGEIVLDGFLGSGSTLIAAERTGRVCRGVEIDPLYVDAIIARWENETGSLATLHGTGETFEEVASRRRAEADAAAPPQIVARARTRTIA